MSMSIILKKRFPEKLVSLKDTLTGAVVKRIKSRKSKLLCALIATRFVCFWKGTRIRARAKIISHFIYLKFGSNLAQIWPGFRPSFPKIACYSRGFVTKDRTNLPRNCAPKM